MRQHGRVRGARQPTGWRDQRPRLCELGARPPATFVTETSPNNFPPLPVRKGEPTVVWLAGWSDVGASAGFEARLAA